MIDPALRGDHPFVRDLAANAANYVPLSPVSFLTRAEAVYPSKIAVRHGARAFTYATFAQRCRRLASALARSGVGRGDTVAVMAPNIPAVLEAHYAVAGLGAVLNALNYRLDAATIGFCLAHGEARVLLTDTEFAPVIRAALAHAGRDVLVVDIDDGEGNERLGEVDYEAFIAAGDPHFDFPGAQDEWDSLALLYTSGTTGDPKGVVYHHRGAYLNALGNALAFGLGPGSVYLWTLPMFHCNGWSYTWAVTAVGATHVCLRRVDPAAIFPAIHEHGVTHLCGAPIVLNMLIHAPESMKLRFDRTVEVATGGAAPPSAVIEAMERMGFRVTHLYGLTESYGPATLCAWQDDWSGLDLEARSRLMARQGVRHADARGGPGGGPDAGRDVPRDGTTHGRGHAARQHHHEGLSQESRRRPRPPSRDGWYHTGDLAAWHPDGYIEIKDRAKDIIISGGENISSLEVEECLYRHPQVMEAAVVARPDARWGETPCAFVTLKDGATEVDAAGIIAWCRAHLAHFKVPRSVVFGPLPKTSTGKIQKFVLRARARGMGDTPGGR